MAALLPLFPANPRRAFSWRGYGFSAHRGARTGKEVIYDRVDEWLYNLQTGHAVGT